jgi:hypothetical protein
LAIIPGSANFILVWAGINSRLALLREFAGNILIYFDIFQAKRRLREEIDEIPDSTGITAKFAPSDGSVQSGDPVGGVASAFLTLGEATAVSVFPSCP